MERLPGHFPRVFHCRPQSIPIVHTKLTEPGRFPLERTSCFGHILCTRALMFWAHRVGDTETAVGATGSGFGRTPAGASQLAIGKRRSRWVQKSTEVISVSGVPRVKLDAA